MSRRLRGIRILKRKDARKVSLKLMLINDHIYVIVIRLSFLGVFFRKRHFQFENLEDAQYFYDRVCFKLFPVDLENDGISSLL
jgi:hypothetical protein